MQLQTANYAQNKTAILAQLAELVSQDGAGISFMTNSLHEIIGGVGLTPGTAAVYNYIVSTSYQWEFIFPSMTVQDVHSFVALAKQSVAKLHKVLPNAISYAEQHRSLEALDNFVRRGGI